MRKASLLVVMEMVILLVTPGFCREEKEKAKKKEPVTTKVELPVTSRRVRVTNMVPIDYEGTIQSWEMKAKRGRVTLTLTAAPLIIEELPIKEKATPSPSIGSRGLPYEDSPFGFIPRSYGMNADLSDWKERCRDAAYIGIRWARSSPCLFWPKAQTNKSEIEKGIFHWDEFDLEYGWAAQAGLNTLVGIAHVWGPEGPYAEKGYKPYDAEAYSDFVKAVVERYDGDGVDDAPGNIRIKYWQVENEPDLFRPGAWQSYAELMKVAYTAIKTADPEAVVLMGGGSGNREYYKQILKELNGRYLDVFDWHGYGGIRGNWDYLNLGRAVEQMRSILNIYGYQDVPMWVTETGTWSGVVYGPGEPRTLTAQIMDRYQSEEAQAADLVKRYVHLLSLGAQKVFWFTLHEDYTFAQPDNMYRNMGLIYNGEGYDDRGKGVKKKAYYTYKVMTSRLEGSDWDNIKTLDVGSQEVHAHRFLKEGNPIYVLWWDNYEDEEARKREHMEKWPKAKPANIPVTPVASWPMDEREGTTLFDRTTNGNDGLINGPTWTEGKRGSALEFDGVDDHVAVKDSSSLDIEKAITLEAWVYPKYDSWPDYGYVISKGESYILALNKGKLYIALHDGTGWTSYTSQTALPLKQWSHVAGTFDGAAAKLYVNGAEVYSEDIYLDTPGVQIAINKSHDLCIGSFTNPQGTFKRFFQGLIDEVKIYQGALTPEEIARDYSHEN